MRKAVNKLTNIVLAMSCSLALAGSGALADGNHDYPDVGHWPGSFVKCDHGQKIQDAVDRAREGDTIKVRGACIENVEIATAGLKLIAVDGASVTAADSTVAVFRVHARDVVIRGFRIVGGSHGVMVYRSGAVILQGNDISNATVTAGVLVTSNSYAMVGGDGPSAANNIHNNPTGIAVRMASSADIFYNTIHHNNRGIQVGGGAIDISNNLIEDNADRGLYAYQNGAVTFSTTPATSGGANVFNRNGVGVYCSLGGSMTGDPQVFGTGTDANGANTSISGSCTVTSGLGF